MRGQSFALVAVLVLAGLSASARPLDEANEDEPSQITVTSLGGKAQRVDFDGEHDTVAGLKAKLAQANGGGRPAANLRLVYAGRVLEDERLLSDYGIQRDSNVICLERKAQPAASQADDVADGAAPMGTQQQVPPMSRIEIKTITGEQFELPARRETTVEVLKQMIAIERAVDLEQIRLVHNGIVLADDKKTLGEFGLQEGSRVMLTLNTASGLMNKLGPQAAGATKQVVALEDLGEEAQAEILGAIVRELSQGEGRMRIVFGHSARFADLQQVRQTIEERVLARVRQAQSFGPFTERILNSDELRVTFGYEFKGKLETTQANLREGAQWIADQAQAILDGERFERDLAEAGATTVAPSGE